jgi:hypothetical protein
MFKKYKCYQIFLYQSTCSQAIYPKQGQKDAVAVKTFTTSVHYKVNGVHRLDQLSVRNMAAEIHKKIHPNLNYRTIQESTMMYQICHSFCEICLRSAIGYSIPDPFMQRTKHMHILPVNIHHPYPNTKNCHNKSAL